MEFNEDGTASINVDDVFGDDSVWHPEETTEDDSSVWHPGEEPVYEPQASTTPTTGAYHINPRMYIYVDMEFTTLERDADYISIGLCDAEGHSFYGEFNDFSLSKVSEWTFKNVCQKLVNPRTELQGDHWQMRGNRKDISTNILIWLDQIHEHTGCGFQFVGDCGHYDMVFLIDLLWGNALRVPEWISPVMVDINNDLANLVTGMYNDKPTMDGQDMLFNPYHHAFNLNRDEYASHVKNAPKGMQHNSMYDAYVIRAIHQSIWDIDLGEMTHFE